MADGLNPHRRGGDDYRVNLTGERSAKERKRKALRVKENVPNLYHKHAKYNNEVLDPNAWTLEQDTSEGLTAGSACVLLEVTRVLRRHDAVPLPVRMDLHRNDAALISAGLLLDALHEVPVDDAVRRLGLLPVAAYRTQTPAESPHDLK